MSESYMDGVARELAESLPGNEQASAELLRRLAEGLPAPVGRLAAARLFRSAEAAHGWLQENAGGMVRPVTETEAFDLGRRARDHCQEVVR